MITIIKKNNINISNNDSKDKNNNDDCNNNKNNDNIKILNIKTNIINTERKKS